MRKSIVASERNLWINNASAVYSLIKSTCIIREMLLFRLSYLHYMQVSIFIVNKMQIARPVHKILVVCGSVHETTAEN